MITDFAQAIWYWPFEKDFILWLQSIGSGTFLQNIFIVINNAISFFGEEKIAVVVITLVYLGIDKIIGQKIALALLLSDTFSFCIKNVFVRLRPHQVVNEIAYLREVNGYSFPSGHSATAASFYPSLAIGFKTKKWLKAFAIILPILVALSRNYLGCHWISDVIVGLAIGYLNFLLVQYVMPKLEKKINVSVIYGIIAVCYLYAFTFAKTDDFFTIYGIFVGCLIAFVFDKKVVHFENTKSILFMALRTIGALLIYFSINELLKVVFSGFFEEATLVNSIFRTIRYALVSYLMLGVYPMIFKPFENWLKVLKKYKNNHEK